MALIAYPHGWDVAWMASDRDGHVALFFTAGEGPIPTAALAALPAPILDCNPNFHALSKITCAKLHRPWAAPGFAERGLFVYDWCDAKVYRLEAAPEQAVLVDDLPQAYAQLARAVTFSDMAFIKSTSVNVRKHFDCCGD